MNELEKFILNNRQIQRQNHITFECFQECQDLVIELMKFCPHNMIKYAYCELDRLHKKYMQEEIFKLQ